MMMIKNKTNQVQELTIYAYTSNGVRPYSIYVVAGGSFELENSMECPALPELMDKGIFGLVGEEKKVQPTEFAVNKAPEDVKADLAKEGKAPSEKTALGAPEGPGESVDEVLETTATPGGNFVCEVCGGEYASERGLKMHIARTHPEV